MSYLRFRDEEESSTAGTITTVLLGAVAGFAVGMMVAQKMGGFSAIVDKVRSRADEATGRSAGPVVADDMGGFEDDDYEDDELTDGAEADGIEERVLEAFRNDPILAERAVDIGAIGASTIELAGWVNTEEEAEHAVTIARGVPGVDTVVNRVAVGDEEERIADHTRRFEAGDDALTEAHWDGRTVGTGRSRQGASNDIGRHENARTALRERVTSTESELAQAADDIEGIAERRHREKKVVEGDRTGGSPIAPTGVPKADHVANPPAR